MSPPDSEYTIDAAYEDLLEAVGAQLSAHRVPKAAGLKPAMQALSHGAFEEGHLGFSTFGDFLREAERDGRISLVRLPQDVAAYPAGKGPADFPETIVVHTSPIRQDLWRTFSDWRPGFDRCYSRSRDLALIFERQPGPTDSSTVQDMRQKLAAASPDVVEIKAIAMDVQISWMREFAGDLSEPDKSALESALDEELPAKAFTRKLADLPTRETLWKSFRIQRVRERIEAWAAENSVEINLSSRNTAKQPERAARANQPAEDEIREALHRAIDKMPLGELLRISIPVEFTLGAD